MAGCAANGDRIWQAGEGSDELACSENSSWGTKSSMEKTSQSDCTCANERSLAPSFLVRGGGLAGARTWRIPLKLLSLSVLALAIVAGGCGTDTPQGAPQAAAKPAEPTIPEEFDLAAKAMLGSGTQVLLYGDLAKNGKQEVLAANVVPKTPTNNLPGTIVTRVVIGENDNGKWSEVLRCDEHLKNQKGYLGLTPLTAITGWRLQYEQSDVKGLELYFTPLKGSTDSHVLPIGVRYNPATKRYQSLDRNYEQFLIESPSIQDARSALR